MIMIMSSNPSPRLLSLLLFHYYCYLLLLLLSLLFFLTTVHATTTRPAAAWLFHPHNNHGFQKKMHRIRRGERGGMFPWNKSKDPKLDELSLSLSLEWYGVDPIIPSPSPDDDIRLRRRSTTAESNKNSNNHSSSSWKSELPRSLSSSNRTASLRRVDLIIDNNDDDNYDDDDDDDDDSTITLYLMGTVHGSKESCEDVQTLLDYVQPDIILVELCPKRMGSLFTTVTTSPSSSSSSLQQQNLNQQRQATTTTTTTTTTIKSFLRNVSMRKKQSNISMFCAFYFELVVATSQLLERITATSTPPSPSLSPQQQQQQKQQQQTSRNSEFAVAFSWWMLELAKKKNCHKNNINRMMRKDDDDDTRPIPTFILGDRDVDETMRQYWREESLWNKYILTATQLWNFLRLSTLFLLDDNTTTTTTNNNNKGKKILAKELEKVQAVIQDVLGSEDGVAKHSLKDTEARNTVFVEQRDVILACNIHRSCSDYLEKTKRHLSSKQKRRRQRRWGWLGRGRKQQQRQQIKMVAIVGAGHVRGIQHCFHEGISNNILDGSLVNDDKNGSVQQRATTATTSREEGNAENCRNVPNHPWLLLLYGKLYQQGQGKNELQYTSAFTNLASR